VSRTVVNGEMSLRRLKLSIYEVVKLRGGGEEEEEFYTDPRHILQGDFNTDKSHGL
jgi:hypothetical protein